MTSIKIGKVTPIPRGEWNSSTTYDKLDIVYNSGSSYIAKKEVPANISLTTTEYWMQLAAKGDTGFGSEWGNITGTLSNQNDLQNELDNKLDSLNTQILNDKIINFNTKTEHAIKDLKVEIDPIQDLHGYDSPWPGGGGKNLLGLQNVTNGTLYGIFYSVIDGIINISGTATDNFTLNIPLVETIDLNPVQNKMAMNNSAAINGVSVYFKRNTTIVHAVNLNQVNRVVEWTASSDETINSVDVIVNSDVSVNVVIKPCLMLKTISDTSFVPYSNVCPITGWDKAVITRTGVNVWGGEKLANDMVSAVNNSTYCEKSTDTDGKFVRLQGNPAIEKTISVGMKFKENTRYTFIGQFKKSNTSGNLNLQFEYTDGTVSNITYSGTTVSSNILLTAIVSSTSGKTVKNIIGKYQSGTTYFYYENCGLFEGVVTVEDFEPYSGTQVTIDLDDTRYGGVLDVPNGILTVDRALVDGGTLSWNTTSATNVFRASISGKAHNFVDADIICSQYKSIAASTALVSMPDKSIKGGSSSTYGDNVYIKDTAYTSSSAFGTAMSGVQICYYLAEPFTVTLTPSQISSLIGENYLWADCGESTVVLRLSTGDLAYQDTVDYETQVINKPDFASMLSGSETEMVATQNYTEGALIGVGDNLYKTLSAIASGTTLTIGSNIIATTIEAELSLKAKSSDVYTKSETNTLLNAKADSSSVYTKAQTDTLLESKADISSVYDKTETDDLLDDKLDANDTVLSGDIVTFEAENDHAIKDVTVAIAPVQDLHGYDAPWPGGGGKNLANPDNITLQSINASGAFVDQSGGEYRTIKVGALKAGTYTISTNLSNPYWVRYRYVYNGETTAVGSTGNLAYKSFTLENDVTDFGFCFRNQSTTPITETFWVQIEQGSSVTSYAPYSNICPISGWDDAKITRTGKNLWSNDYFATENNPMTLITDPTDPDYGYYNGYMARWENYYDFSEGKMGFFGVPLNLGRVTVSMTGKTKTGSNNINIKIYFLYDDGTISTSGNTPLTSTPNRFSRVSTEGKNCIAVCITSMAGINDARPCLKDVQIELGDTMTDYEEPTRQSVTVDLGETRYSGTLDVTTGTLTVDRAFVTIDDTASWTQYAAGKYYVGNVTVNPAKDETRKLYISNLYPFGGNGNTASTYVTTDKYFYGQMTYGRIWVYDSAYQTLDAFKAMLHETPMQVVYPIETPLTIQLTPQQISSLIGLNHLWADTGDSIVTLRLPVGALAFQNTADYETQVTNKPDFGSMLSGTEESMTATRNYTTGSLIAVKDELYKALTAIASGTTLTVGTNVTATTIEAELALKANTTDLTAQLATKANVSDVYNKTEVDTALEDKADKSNTYEKSEVDYVVQVANTAVTGYASGDIATFTDGADLSYVKDLKVTINPVQDLHGYDNPWPAGGGKNLLNVNDIAMINSTASNIRAGIYFTKTGTYTVSANKVGSQSGVYISARKKTSGGTYETATALVNNSAISTSSATYTLEEGDTLIVFNALEGVSVDTTKTYFESFQMQIESGSSTTSYAPYSNVCPISGHTSAVVTRTGKNLFDYSARLSNYYLDVNTGQPVAQNGYYVTPYIPVQAGKPIVFLGSGSGRRWLYDIYKNPVTYLNNSGMQVYTPPIDGFVRITVSGTSERQDTYQIEYGTAPTEYEPYSDTSVTVDLGEERYGGVLDVTTGILTLTNKQITVDGNTDISVYSGWRFRISVPDYTSPASTVVDSIYCDKLKTISKNISPQNYSVCSTDKDGKYILLMINSDITTTSAMSAWLAQNPLQIVYPLDSPVTVQLTPAQLSTALGLNNIWTDTAGSTEVVYCKDIASYVASHHDDEKAAVITETASGSIVSITDGSPVPVVDLNVNIDPVQDLHGYDAPWPAGGGKNLIDPSKRTSTAQTVHEWYKADGFTLLANTTYTLSANSNESLAVYINDKSTETQIVGGHATETYTPTEDTLVYFRLYKASDVASVELMLEKSASATAYAPYSNICPITGWTQATVTRMRKNVLPKVVNGGTASGVTYTVSEDGTITLSGTCTSSTAIVILDNIYIKAGHYYLWDFAEGTFPSNGTSRIQILKQNTVDTIFNIPNNETPSGIYENDVESGLYRIRIRFDEGHTYNNCKLHPMLVLGSERPTAYESYQGTQITIDLGDTRYGGTLNVLTGVLTVTWTARIFDGTTTAAINFAQVSAESDYVNVRGLYSADLLGSIPGGASSLYNTPSKFKASHFKWWNYNVRRTITPDNICWNSSAGKITWFSSTFTTLEQFNGYLQDQYANGTPVTLAYWLTTPLTVQLTPSQMTTLLGINNLWANTGNLTVEYKADTKLYIQRLTKPTEDDMIANANIANGKFFMVGNNLYLSTASISAGETIIPGSNCTALSLADALNNLNS